MNLCGKSLPPAAASLLGTNTLLLVLGVPLVVALHATTETARSFPAVHFTEMLLRLGLLGTFCLFVFYYAELYHLQIARNLREQTWRIFRAIAVVLLVMACAYWLFPSLSPGRDAILGLPLAWMAVLLLTRNLAVVTRRTTAVIIGPSKSALSLAEGMRHYPEWNLEIAGILKADDLDGIKLPPKLERIIVCGDAHLSHVGLCRLIDLKLQGVKVETAAQFLERATGRIELEEVDPEWFIFSTGFDNDRRKLWIKRCFDVAISGVLFLLVTPLMLLAALAIIIEGKGPVFYRQERVGVHGKRFWIFKFRTMVPVPPGTIGIWTSNQDSRVTKLGQILRKYRIDELPQLLNILLGEMSLVGPRPEQPHYCDMLATEIPYYHQRHTVPPGLTGWAQVRFHYGASIEESRRKLEYDLFYVKNLSLWLDLAIGLDTLKVVLTGHGAK